MTSNDLLWAYQYYNRKYFGGKLPEGKVRFKKANNWILDYSDLGATNLQTGEIYIADSLRRWEGIAYGTLLHEMVHLSLPVRVYHGRKFQQEMLRPAKAGAFKEIW